MNGRKKIPSGELSYLRPYKGYKGSQGAILKIIGSAVSCQTQCSRVNTFVIEWFIHSFIEPSFCSESSRHCLFQTVKGGELKFLENVHLTPCVPCHVSHVTCHLSGDTCHMWGSPVTFYLWQSGGASRCKVCYQRRQPCLASDKVFFYIFHSSNIWGWSLN